MNELWWLPALVVAFIAIPAALQVRRDRPFRSFRERMTPKPRKK